MFKVADLTHRWTVVLNRSHLDDIGRASDTELSFGEAANEVINFFLARFSAIIGLMHVYVACIVVFRSTPAHWCMKNIQVQYTLSPAILHDMYHNSILRSQLTRNLGAVYPDIRNELVIAFEETLDLKADGEIFRSTSR